MSTHQLELNTTLTLSVHKSRDKVMHVNQTIQGFVEVAQSSQCVSLTQLQWLQRICWVCYNTDMISTK